MKTNGNPNVLFLVHVEEMFRHLFPDELYGWRVYRSAVARKYQRVIVLESGVDEPCRLDGHPGGIIRELEGALHHSHVSTEVWSWGYEKGMFYEDSDPDEEDQFDWIIPAHGHEWTWVPQFLRDDFDYYNHAEVFLGGGYASECLADWEDVLDYLEIPYVRIQGLVYW